LSEPWSAADREAALLGLDVATRRLVRTWTERDGARVDEIPWTPLPRPLRECRVALVSSSAIALRADAPFDQEGERRNPWWGDPSFRVIPRGTRTADVRVWHLHVDPALAEADLNCALPLDRLDELAGEGAIGAAARSHYSFMGYVLKPRELLERSVPAMIGRMREEGVDAVALVPV
jgi:D-proline reductase (dithiol) PrdB